MKKEETVVSTGGVVYHHGDQDHRAGYNLSWGSIFAGLVTFIALLIAFTLVGSALGFGQFNPAEPNPFAGVATGQAIWWVIAWALSFLGAGFVSGMASRRMGMIHGFLTWALSLIGVVVLTIWMASSLVTTVGNVAGTALEGAGNVVASVADTAGSAVSASVDAIASSIDTQSADVQELQDTVQSVLEDTEIEELQPEYLTSQLQGAIDDVTTAGAQLVLNPNQSDQIINDLTTSLEDRINSITENLDEEAVVNAVENNTDLTEAEAEEAVQNIVEGYNQAADQARAQLQSAADSLESLAQDAVATAESVVDDVSTAVTEGAQEATDAISSGSIWAFVAVLVGAVLSCVGGSLGVNFVTRMIHEQRA